MDIRNNKAEITSVTLTLAASDVRTMAHLYKEAGDREMDENLPYLAADNYRAAAWLYRAIGDAYFAELFESKADGIREEARAKREEEEGA